jgi:hypothetical protein
MSDGLSFALTMATPIGMAGFYAWVILVHSKRRWPHTTAHERLVHVTTMDGQWMREHDRKARLIDGDGA